jgi:hypothetical protein
MIRPFHDEAAYLSWGGNSMTGLFGAVVCEIADAAAVVPVVAISGNCWRKLARKSSPGFCELRLKNEYMISILLDDRSEGARTPVAKCNRVWSVD